MSQGSNIIGKLFGKHKKEEKILNTSSHAGKSKGESENSSAKTNAGTSIRSDEEVFHGNGAGGQTVSPATFDTSKHVSSKGQVVSSPPRVNRQPLEQAYGGDYADGKTPTEVSTYTSKSDGDKGLIDNHSPRYDNEATLKKGQGQFFDPRDTQGGLYKSGAGEHENTGTREAPVGAAAAAASAALAGGVSKGGYGKDSEATHAQLHQKNLKTQPTVYTQEEDAKKFARDLEAKAFSVGQERGASDVQKDQKTHGSSHSKTVDPKSEHKKNKSAYNEGGLAGATAEAKHDHEQYSGTETNKSTGLGSNKGASNSTAGGYEGANLASDKSSGFTQQKTLDPAVDSVQHGAALHDSKAKPETSTTYQKTTIVNVNTPHNVNYDEKIQRLDKSIAETQKEIDALEKKSAKVVPEPSIHPYGVKDSSNHASKGDSKGIIGAAAAAVGLGGAGYAGHKESEKQAYSSPDPKTTTIAQAGIPSGQPAHVNTQTDSVEKSAAAAGPLKESSEKRSATSEIETAAYNAGHAKGFNSKEAVGGKQNSSIPTNETTGSSNPGLFGGITGAATAAGAVAASAVGLSGQTGHDDKKAATDSVTEDDGTLKADVDNSYYNAGYAKGQAERGLSEPKQTSTEVAKEDSHTTDGGYLDSAKAAIASAGVAAAGAFGYEGYNKYYNTEEHTKDVIDAREKDDSLFASSQKVPVDEKADSQTKPSATASSAQHPGATATYGTSALAKEKDSRAPSSVDNNESAENKSDGLLSKLGLGSASPKSAKKSENGTAEKEAHAKDSSKIGSTVAGAVAGAAGAVGLSKTTKTHKVDSLVEEAAAEFDDVKKEPRHKNDGGVLDESSKARDVPDDLDPSQQKASEAETSGVDNTKLEADIAAYNKKHGYTEKKSLIEVAEEKHPEIKQEAAHHKSEDILATEESFSGGPAQGGIAGGLAATAAGKKLLDSEQKGQKGSEKDVAKSSKTAEKDSSKPFESAAAGKSKGESDEIEEAAHRHSSVHPVPGAVTGKPREESKEIEEAAFKAGEAQPHSKSSKAKGGVSGDVPSERSKHESREIESFPAAPSQAKTGLESYSLPAATGKSRQESAEIEEAAHLAGSDKARSASKPVTEAATGKSKAESKEIEQAAFLAGAGAAAGAGVGSVTGETRRKSSISSPVNGSVVGKNRRDSIEIQEAAQLSPGRRRSQAINGSVVGRNRSDSIEIQEAAQSLSGRRVSPPVVGSVVGKSRRDSIEIQEAAQLGGARRSSVSKPVTDAATGKSKAESREIEGAAFAANKKTSTSPQVATSASRPVIEVIGIPDRAEAQEVAQQTTRELLKKGEDLSGSKIIIDANKKEVYKEAQTSTRPTETVFKSASGSAGGLAANTAASQQHPDVSYFDSQKEVDGSKNHKEHERVKQTLADEAEKGKLGNVPAESKETTTKYHSPEGSPRGFAPDPLGAGERQHSYSHKNDSSGKETTYTEVVVSGEPDTKRAQVLAQDAIASLQGRKDILGTTELRVDAHTGAITNQDGLFVAQLSQRRLSQVEGSKRRTSSGGLVNLSSDYRVAPSTSPVSHHHIPRGLSSEDVQKSTASPFGKDYNLASAQTTAKTDSGYKMPGSFL